MSRKLKLGSLTLVVGAATVMAVVQLAPGAADGFEVDGADASRGSAGWSSGAAPRNSTPKMRLARAGEIRLEEPEGALLGELTSLDRDGRGRMVVADRMSGRISIYDRTGSLLRLVGRSGEGPGEFVRPVDAVYLDDGSIAVVETGRPRITRYEPTTDSVSVYRLRDAYYGQAAAGTEGRLAVFVNRPGADAPRVQIYDLDGRLAGEFHRMRPEYSEVPYWSAMTKGLLAAGGGRIVAGGNLMLPLALYGIDGTARGSVARELPGWEPVPRPARGRFAGSGARRRFEAWRRTFPTLDAIEVYRDSLLVVAVERLDEDVLSTEIADYEAHVFDLRTGDPVGSLELPGRLLHADDLVYCLTSGPPNGWTVSRFSLESR